MDKKKLVGWIAGGVLALGAVGGGTAGIIVATHEHEYSTEWKYDEVNHWHEATCSHGEEISDLAEHTFDSGVVTPPSCTAKGYTAYTCTVCGATKTGNVTEMVAHVFDDGVATAPTCTESGYTTYTCTVCHGTKVDDYVNPTGHSFTNAWTSDESHHWHTSTCGHDVISDKTAHSLVLDYVITGEDAVESVSTNTRCTICNKTHASTTLNSSDYVILTEDDLTSNAITLSTANALYILDGTFTSTAFTVDAENVTIVGSHATTSNIAVSYTTNAKNSVVYGMNMQANRNYNVYGDASYVKCNLSYIQFKLQNDNINLHIDSNNIGGDYGIYINYYTDTSDNCNVYITNNTFDAIGIYSIFISGSTAESELGELVIANNNFINGWGISAPGAKRATLKLHQDKNLCPESFDDISDTSKLTASAIELVKEILASNNTYDKAGFTCSYFNIDGIYFDIIE